MEKHDNTFEEKENICMIMNITTTEIDVIPITSTTTLNGPKIDS